MSVRLQRFLLANTKPMQNFINNNLAQRSGLFGAIGRAMYMGERQLGGHSMWKTWRVVNYFWMMGYQVLA